MSASRSADTPVREAERAERYRLDVTAGPQRGAHALVDAGVRTTIGAGEADIVLLDPRVGDLVLSIADGEEGLLVEASGEGAHRDGEALAPGVATRHVDGARYTLGISGFTLTPERDVLPALGDGEVWSAVTAAPRPSTAFPPDARREGPRSHGLLPKVMLGLAASLLVATGISWALHRDPLPDGSSREAVATGAPAATVPPPDPAALLDEAGFESVSFVAAPGTAGRVGGYVESRARLLELQRTLRDLTPAPSIDVHVQQAVVNGVRDFFRTNGLLAEVSSTGPGTVRVVTAERDAPDVARLVSAVRRDVPGLRSLASVNEVPEAEPAGPDAVAPPRVAELPGKRVVAVVQGDPSYVVTADDSRYFVGSSLPTGHTIAGIEEAAVLLEWQGTRTKLEF